MKARATCGNRGRKALWVVAYAALSLILVRPVCEAEAASASHASGGPLRVEAHAHAGAPESDRHGDEGEYCCASMGEAATSEATDMAAAAEPGVKAPIDFRVRGGPAPTPDRSLRVRFAFDPPSPPLSYYARSARILR